MVLVYAIVKAEAFGWGSARTLGLIAVGIALLVAFVVVESRIKGPLVRLGIFKIRSLAVANFALLLVAGGLFALFFFATPLRPGDPAASRRSRPAWRSCR